MAKGENEGKKEGQKLTYDELLQAAKDLNAQNTYLKQQLQAMSQKLGEVSNYAMFKRLDYLFEVVKNDSKFPSDFVVACTDEIVSTMTPPEEAPEGGEEKKEG